MTRQAIIFGKQVAEVLESTLSSRGVSRVLLVTSKSLIGADQPANAIRLLLGDRCVAAVADLRAHSPMADAIRVARALRDCGGHAVVAVGGGSVCDTVKLARLCFANDVFSLENMDVLRRAEGLRPPGPVSIMVPTTLSAGEFTPFAGVLNEAAAMKEGFQHDLLAPDVVILDPWTALRTPRQLWFSTGLRAVDHAIETWCAIDSTPMSDATSLHGLRLLLQGLAGTDACAEDPASVLQCQTGSWLAIQGMASGVNLGASHGVGHALGGVAGMPHGETSCVMLPHVLRHNAEVNGSRQAAMVTALNLPSMPLADIVAKLVAQLNLPTRLRDSQIELEALPRIAQVALQDRWLKTNPRPITRVEEALELLNHAW